MRRRCLFRRPPTRTTKPGRRVLWLGLLTLGLLAGIALVGMRLFGEGTIGPVAEPSVPPLLAVPLPTVTVVVVPAPTVAQAVVPAQPAPTLAPPQQSAAVQPPVPAPTVVPLPTAVSPPVPTAVALAPPLSNPRYLHTATRLDDGKILVAGGRSESAPLDTAESV